MLSGSPDTVGYSFGVAIALPLPLVSMRAEVDWYIFAEGVGRQRLVLDAAAGLEDAG